MFEFLVLFFPGILSVALSYSQLRNNDGYTKIDNKADFLKFIRTAILYIFINNLLSLFIFTKLYNITSTIVDGHLNPDILSIRYLLITFIIALISGFIGLIIRLNINFSLLVESRHSKSALISTEKSENGKQDTDET